LTPLEHLGGYGKHRGILEMQSLVYKVIFLDSDIVIEQRHQRKARALQTHIASNGETPVALAFDQIDIRKFGRNDPGGFISTTIVDHNDFGQAAGFTVVGSGGRLNGGQIFSE
jgi:hypothetical protein